MMSTSGGPIQSAEVGQISLPNSLGARHQQLLRAGAQPDHLQQADRRLHAQHAQVRVPGYRGVRHQPAGDHHRRHLRSQGRLAVRHADPLQGNIFNISKINSEVRGGKSPRIKRLSEYIGESYFDYLAGLPDLVLLMDESHRYRASAGVRAINELKPILGLELTATPFVETSKGAVAFKNVVCDYPLGRAMADGFVKEPAVVTRKNFNPASMSPEEIERLKLEDGVRLHEIVKVELETYARETDSPIVKPYSGPRKSDRSLS